MIENFKLPLFRILAIISLILSIVAKSKAKSGKVKYNESPERYKGVGMLKAGKIISIISLAISIIIIIVAAIFNLIMK